MLLEQLNEGVIAVDRTLTIAFANAAARELLSGQELAEGAPLPEPWPQLELRGLANRLFLEGASVGQARVAPGDGRTFALAGIPAGRGSRLAVVVITDVSERERRERAEREFVANAAHELRTPITAIGNALDALELGALDVPEDREKFLGVVRRQSDRLGRLVRALLVLARAQTRQEPLRLEAVQVRPLLEEAASMLDTAEGVHPEIDCPPGVWVLAQRDLVGQVVANLASNAAKHTRRGRIVLAAANGPGDAVTLEVRDTGGGVPPHERARIFDRFYSSDGDQREGFGLGLAIVREAVRALGGVVDVTSTAQGTTVRVTLASARKEAA
jgi:two-component system sensor histidine kinase ResE